MDAADVHTPKYLCLASDWDSLTAVFW